MFNGFWVWLTLVAIWNFVILCILNMLREDESTVFYCFGAIFMFLILLAAIGGSVEFLKYFQVWPFTPQ